jgi:hypothetical protein
MRILLCVCAASRGFTADHRYSKMDGELRT